jgi:ATP-dependent Clp protease adapter protein ClpS
MTFRQLFVAVGLLLVVAGIATVNWPPVVWEPGEYTRMGLVAVGLLVSAATAIETGKGLNVPPVLGERPYRDDECGLVLHNDETHGYAYVIQLLRDEFGFGLTDAFVVTDRISKTGRAVVHVGSWGDCEERRRAVELAGPDPALPASTGPLVATVERMADLWPARG